MKTPIRVISERSADDVVIGVNAGVVTVLRYVKGERFG